MEKPLTIEEYKNWLKQKHESYVTEKAQSYFETVANKMARDFKQHIVWEKITDSISDLNREYFVENGYNLFLNTDIPEIYKKNFESFLHKTHRKNVLNNENWPEPPRDGWILPKENEWFARINDIVRTSFVVKYFDGVKFFIEALSAICNELNLECKKDFEAKEDGYYAAHFYISIKSEVPKEEDWKTRSQKFCVEIQITTQIKETIKKLLHGNYKKSRESIYDEEKVWQWDYKSDEFSTNYLGHVLHYIEGMIMGLIDKKKLKK